MFSQTASATLERSFARDDLSWLLMDGAGHVLAQHWNDIDTPIAPGSLVKPFVALAYGEQHKFQYPRLHCSGTVDRCWLPKGHGDLRLTMAIAHSCNAYFIGLVKDLDRAQAHTTFARFGLRGPPTEASDSGMIGLGAAWRERPIELAHAYLQMLDEHERPGTVLVTAGMVAAAQMGTARAVDAALGSGAALAKTGTAPCFHAKHAEGDGLAIVLYPAPGPRMLLVVQLHRGTGAQAAQIAGAMLHALGEDGS